MFEKSVTGKKRASTQSDPEESNDDDDDAPEPTRRKVCPSIVNLKRNLIHRPIGTKCSSEYNGFPAGPKRIRLMT